MVLTPFPIKWAGKAAKQVYHKLRQKDTINAKPPRSGNSPGAFFCVNRPKTCANGTCIGGGCYNGSIKNTQEKGGYDHERKKFLALALAGVMTAVTLTACTPLDAAELLYDWLFGGGSSNASHGSEKSLVKESVELEDKLKAYLRLSETTASDRAKETLEAVAKGFDAEWLDNNKLNDKAKDALIPITQDKVQVKQALWVDVMELTSPDGTADITLDNRPIYSDRYVDPGPGSGDPYHWVYLVDPSNLRRELDYYKKNDAELYAGTFQKAEKITPRWSR